MARQRSMEAIRASEYVSIGELVRLTQARYSTLKFYTEEGFLPFCQEDRGLTRRYPRESTVQRLTYSLSPSLSTVPSAERMVTDLPSASVIVPSQNRLVSRLLPVTTQEELASI